jgi:hypothetical protein
VPHNSVQNADCEPAVHHQTGEDERPSPQDAMSKPGAEVAAGARLQADRTRLFRYLTGDLFSEYRQVMSLFTTQLLGDLSAADVAARLPELGLHLSPEDVTARCEQLEGWGATALKLAAGRDKPGYLASR